MVSHFSTSYLTKDELKTEFRNYKLKAISGDFVYNLSPSAFQSDISEKIDFIVNTMPEDIISGSLALYLLGLIHRNSNDIDIIIPDKNRFDKYTVGDYDDEFTTPNRLGYRQIKYKKNFLSKEKTFEVDFFENKNASFLTFSYGKHTIKIHHPLEIMQFKLDIINNTKAVSRTSRKHNEDLTRIFGQTPWQQVLSGQIKL